jgi:hypothetical protein
MAFMKHHIIINYLKLYVVNDMKKAGETQHHTKDYGFNRIDVGKFTQGWYFFRKII